MRNLTKVQNFSTSNKNEKAMDKNLIIQNLEKRPREKKHLGFSFAVARQITSEFKPNLRQKPSPERLRLYQFNKK